LPTSGRPTLDPAAGPVAPADREPWWSRTAMSRRTVMLLAWVVIILGLCWYPKSLMPIEEGPKPVGRIPHLDKVIHFGMFAILGWLGMFSGRRPMAARSLGIFLLGLGVAILSELGQMAPIVGRDAGLDDLAADLLGVVAGMAAFAFALPGFRVPSPETP
jgi:VanZ family protein